MIPLIHSLAEMTADHLEALIKFLEGHHSHSLFDAKDATLKCHEASGCGFINFRLWGKDGSAILQEMVARPRLGDHIEKEAMCATLVTGSDMACAACFNILRWRKESDDPASQLSGRGFRQRAYIEALKKKLATMRGVGVSA